MKEIFFVFGFISTLVTLIITEEAVNKNKSKSSE